MSLRRLAQLAFVSSLAIAALSILGWISGALILASHYPRAKAIAPLSALAFLVASIFLLVSQSPGRRHWRPRDFLYVASFVALAAATVAGLDFLAFDGFLQSRILAPLSRADLRWPNDGRTSAFTMASLLVLGLALLLVATSDVPSRAAHRRLSIAATLSFLVSLGGLSIVVGFLSATPLLSGSVSFPSGLVLCFFGLGLGFECGEDAWPLRYFVGASMQARLARAIVPLCALITISEQLLLGLVSQIPGAPPLVSVLSFMVFTCLLAALIYAVLHGLAASFERILAERAEAESKLSQSLAAEERLMGELNHRTRNSLQLVISLVDLESLGGVPGASLRDRVGALALVHDCLARGEDPSALAAGDLLRGLASYLEPKGRVAYRCQGSDFSMLYDLAAPLAILGVEVDGILRASLPGSGGEVDLELSLAPEGGYLFEYRATWPLGGPASPRFEFAQTIAHYQLDGEIRVSQGSFGTAISITVGVCAYGRRI